VLYQLIKKKQNEEERRKNEFPSLMNSHTHTCPMGFCAQCYTRGGKGEGKGNYIKACLRSLTATLGKGGTSFFKNTHSILNGKM